MQQLEEQKVLEGEYLPNGKMSREEYISYLRNVLTLNYERERERHRQYAEMVEERTSKFFRDFMIIIGFACLLGLSVTGVLPYLVVEVFQWIVS